MNPFFSYYGGKWTMARRLMKPQRDHVVEPFAGSAGYSTYYEPPRVTLYELDPTVYSVWDYLIHTRAAEIKALPARVEHIDDVHACQEAKWLIGYWLNIGTSKPASKPSNWTRRRMEGQSSASNVWHASTRDRIASQVDKIRHWVVINKSYETAPNFDAHWHVDPPYQCQAGRAYRYNQIDYAKLGNWCRERKGFVQVCEAVGATWLPFREYAVIKGSEGKNRKGYSAEAVYEQGLVQGFNFDEEEKTMPQTKTVEQELVTLTGIKPKRDRQAFLADVCEAVNTKISEEQFRSLSPEAVRWFNSAMDVWNDKSATIPDMNASSEDAGSPPAETEEEPEMKNAKTAKAKRKLPAAPPKGAKTAKSAAKKKTAGAKPASPPPSRGKNAAAGNGKGRVMRDLPPLNDQGLPTIVKRVVLEDPQITTDDLVARCKKETGTAPSRNTVSTIRSTFAHGIRVLQEAGLVKKDLRV